MKIFRATDRIPVKIGEVTIFISPLTAEHKGEVISQTKMVGGDVVADTKRMIILTLKYAVKGVSGVTYYDDVPMELKFDEDGTVSDESIAELMQIDSDKLVTFASHLIANRLNEEIPGVEIDFKSVTSSKKN
jgi:hypothetical protein